MQISIFLTILCMDYVVEWLLKLLNVLNIALFNCYFYCKEIFMLRNIFMNKISFQKMLDFEYFFK